MTVETFERRIDKLKNNNPDLIDEYINKRGEDLDEYIHDMFIIFERLQRSLPNADPIGFVQNALHISISNNLPIIDAMHDIVKRATSKNAEPGTLQQYFNEISRVYDKHNNDYNIVYCPENREKLIEMNLKTVIAIAKGYQGLGLSLEELISAGNLGLVTSFDKYDPARAKLKNDMIDSIETLDDSASVQDILKCIQQYLTYGDVKRKFAKSFAKLNPNQNDECDVQILGWKEFTKHDVVKWIKRNVKNATFNSVAFMWIRAYILIEIDNHSRLVKKPKSEIYNDKVKYGAYRKEVTLDIDAPINDDSDTKFGDILNIEDGEVNDLEVSEAYDTFKEGLNKLLDGVKPRDRSVFLKKFGIGLPRPMLPKEIAEQENLSIARISQIFQSVVEQMQKNQVKYNINPNILFDAARKLD